MAASKKRVKKAKNNNKKQKQILFKCSGCGTEELIPEDVVNYFDTFDDGDTSVPPRFTCEECCELMEPVEYEGVHGITYKIED
jgi:hypothetical protein